ncbi:glutathione S-transferase family protein, partial [Nostoc sp. NIES-2111]
MGMMIDGVWHRDDGIWARGDGRFERRPTTFRNWVTADGSPGPTGEGGFKAEPGRYVLYVSLACPWAHRALIVRRLKELEAAIPVSVVHWRMLEDGWAFEPGPGVVPDPVFGARVLSEVYA